MDIFGDNPARRAAQDLFEEVRHESEKAPFASVIQLDSIFKKKTDQINQREVPEFLGLSPEEIDGIIYFPFSFDRGPLEFTAKDHSDFSKVPIVQEATYFLDLLRSAGELKATNKGNLPRTVVRELWERFHKSELFSFQPTGEEDCRQVYNLRWFLVTCGYVKKRQGKFSLTQKGLKIATHGQIFQDLFLCAATQFNWEFDDRYSGLPLVQQALGFNLFILFQRAREWVPSKELGLIFFNAFPALESQVRPLYGEAKEEVVACFSIRFLRRFAQRFGLVEIQEGSGFLGEAEVRITPFFLENFKRRGE